MMRQFQGELTVPFINNEMHLVYQPIHDRRNKILAYEALIRCKSKELGLVSPMQVINSFEQSQLVDLLNNSFFNLLQKDIINTVELQQSRLCINSPVKPPPMAVRVK